MRIKLALNSANGNQQTVYRRLARALAKLRAGKGGAKITLRTLRHQARSNLVAAGASDAEIAAVFGHACQQTAITHYGSRRSGWPLTLHVTPDPELVQRVRLGSSLASKVRLGRPTTWGEHNDSRHFSSAPVHGALHL